MSIDANTIKKLGRLARLRIQEGTEEALAKEVSGILGWIEQLGEVKTDGVEPLTSVAEDMQLRSREDVINDGNIQNDILANAPKSEKGFFVVPKVVE